MSMGVPLGRPMPAQPAVSPQDLLGDLAAKRISTLIHIRHVLAEVPWSSSSAKSASPGDATPILQQPLQTLQPPPPPPLWLNILRLPDEEVRALFNNQRMQQRSRQLFTLGASLGTILNTPSIPDFIRGFGILMSEYDAVMQEGTKTKKRSLFRKSKVNDESSSTVNELGAGLAISVAGMNDSTAAGEGDGLGPNSGSAFSIPSSAAVGLGTQLSPLESGQFTYLDVRHIPSELDFFQTLDTFCLLMAKIYHKILAAVPTLPNAQMALEAVTKSDAKIRKIIQWIVKDLELLATSSIAIEIERLDPLRLPTSPTAAGVAVAASIHN
ncbi:hypothetical protein GQ42DRAFT_162049 [Ramicandelaber brevisporus]|nr:hypothetical protein GQ42DRAFT_162049 [Ramicandelaber brevisporus]